MFARNGEVDNYVTPDSYSFSGNILSSLAVYPEVSLVVEERDNTIYGVTLKNHEFLSEKILNSGMDYSEVNDFNIVLSEYNNDNNKDFAYIYDKADEGYIYKFYSIDEAGNIVELNLDNVTVDTKKASLKFTKSGEKYEYIIPNFYYNGYKVSAEIGEHKLTEKSDKVEKTISRDSKISVEGRFDALPRKVYVLKEIPEYVQNVNNEN